MDILLEDGPVHDDRDGARHDQQYRSTGLVVSFVLEKTTAFPALTR